MKIKRGSTSVRRLIFIADSSSATGAGLANLAYNSSGLVAYYFAGDLNNEVQITLASATLGSYTSGGFVAVDNTNMPGWYEIGIPDAALDGGNEVAIQLRGATNMVPVNVYIELDAVDYQSATNFGLSKFADIETDTQDIQSRLPSALVGGRMDSVAANLDALVNSTQSQVLERSLQDNKPINITWPTTGATITATVSINNGSFVPTVGTVSFLRTESTGKHVYALSYNAADRPPAEGQARYVVTDGTYTRSFALRVENQGVPPVGSRSVSITVRDTNSNAIQGATVRLERAGYAYTQVTNNSGVVAFSVDDATYTVSITAGGFSFTPTTLVVDGNETVTYQMTASSVNPSAPPYTTGFWTVLDLNGVAQPNAQVTIQAANPPKDSTGLVLEDAPRTATANGSGVVQFTNLVKGATYIVYRTGSTRKFNVTVPANAGNTVALGSIVG